MLAALALSAAIVGNIFRDQMFTITLPRGAHAIRSNVNFETESYSIRDTRNREIVSIVAGGGSYDLHQGYRRLCLNGSVAWIHEHGSSGTLVAGHPGMSAVSVTYVDLDAQRLRLAKEIVASLRLLEGGTRCHS